MKVTRAGPKGFGQKIVEDDDYGPLLRELLKWPRPLPLEDEWVRLLHEVGLELERSFDGKASNLVESCGKSAVKLVSLVTRHFSGFRDHSVYKGHQVFLYKRVQIFAADVWSAFKGQGYGEFKDIGSITIFADYIVPAVLQQLGVLKFSPELTSIIEADGEIGSGTEEEVELRACSVYAVEKMRELIRIKSGKKVLSVELDLWLWSVGIHAQPFGIIGHSPYIIELTICCLFGIFVRVVKRKYSL